jgi:hypothetical protein
MPLLTIVPPMPGAERRFQPFVDFVHTCGWETEFVRLEWTDRQPDFGSTALFPQIDVQTAGKVVLGYSLGALYAHLGALRARHLILGSISPFFLEDDDEPERWMISYRAGNAHTPADILVGALEDEQMHRRATAVYEFYRTGHRAPATDQGSLPRSPNSDLGLRSSASPSTHYPLPTTRYFPSPTYTDVQGAEHELWHPNFLQAIKTALERLQGPTMQSRVRT